jgi:hypothetical protein
MLACILFYWIAGSRSVLRDRSMTSTGATVSLFTWLACCVGFAYTLHAGGFW